MTKVLHLMLGRGLGGIEQVFLDYTKMMRAEGVEVLPVIHPKAAIRPQVPDALLLPNFNKWDVLAMWRLKQLIATHKPDIILTHGNRALSLSRYVAGNTKLIAVAHNYWIKHFAGLKNAIAITEDIAGKLLELGVKQVSVVPNVVFTEPVAGEHTGFKTPPVIGAMGRFVHKKGFDIFLDALAELKTRDVTFKAILGGTGDEEQKLKTRADELGLKQEVTFPGWVEDKKAFFEQIDIFCVPSRSEPFGIVLLEAFAYSVPVITSKSEGARAIITTGKDALFFEEDCLADAIEYVIRNKELSPNLVRNARETLQRYRPEIIGKQLKAALA